MKGTWENRDHLKLLLGLLPDFIFLRYILSLCDLEAIKTMIVFYVFIDSVQLMR